MKKLVVIAILILIVLIGLYAESKLITNKTIDSVNISHPQMIDQKPKIVSTKPDPLENAIIPADQIVEITFNLPLQNSGEFKLRIEPKIDFKIQLSQDRKTAKIIPVKPYELGTTYTIFIGTDTKFDGVGAWGQEKIYHFKTIKYTGV